MAEPEWIRACQLPCRQNPNWNAVRALLNGLYGPYVVTQNGLFVSQVANEQRGRCVWTVNLIRGDGNYISSQEHISLFKRMKKSNPINASVIECHAQFDGALRVGVVVTFLVDTCNCPQDFCRRPTRLAICAQPRICSDIYIDIDRISEMVEKCNGEETDKTIDQLFSVVLISANNNAKLITVTLVHTNPDDEEEEETISVEGDIATIINLIKTKIHCNYVRV